MSFSEKFIAIFDNLMSSANKVEVVFLKENTDNVRAEDERDSSVVFLPSLNVLLGV